MEPTRRLFHRNTLRNDHFPRSCHNNVVLLYYLENGQSQCAEDAGTCCQKQRAKQRVYQSKQKTEAKVLKTSFVVVGVYMTCWTPLSVMGFIEVFGGESPHWAEVSSLLLKLQPFRVVKYLPLFYCI